MFKDIISHQEGQYLFPGMPTVIKGNESATPITMKGLQKPQIAVTPYGASYMTPGMDYNFAGNTVAEIPVAQMGGSQQDQITQLIVAYAQKIGKDPKEIIAQLQQLSQQEQQQALQAIVQDMQQSAPGADADQDMMEQGGCIDCQEQFPQAQNLNWFYKAQGGEAFPQANMYPESWVGYSGNQYAEGGESFPQAQTYLPYDRPGETRRNFMFQAGGTLYDYVKSLGFDPSYQSRKKLFSQYFDEPYTGTSEQNIYLLNALKSGKVTLAERPKLGSVGFPKSQSFFNQQESKSTKSAPSKSASTKSAPVKSYVASDKSYKVEVPGIITSKSDSPRMTSPLVGIPTAPVKRSVLPKADQAQKEADQRAIPQTGVIVDKRSGEAVVLGPAGARTFPVLTGRNVEGNINPYLPKDLTFEYMSTPTGYYMLGDRSARGGKMKKDEFAGNVGMWMNPIPAYNVPAPVANYVAMHGTYDPAVREPLYNAPAEERNVSMGCVNCGPTDFQHMMGTLGGPDTLMVVDSKRPEDSRLFNQAKKEAEFRMDPRNNYSVVATEPRGYTTTGYEYGGQSDIDKIYQVMKKGGFNINPKKKRGGKLDTNSFMDYVMKNGGYVPEYQDGRELGSEELFPETRRERRMRERLERDMGEKVKQPKSPRFPVNPYNPTALEYANMMTTNTGKPTLTQGILAGMNLFSGLSDAFSGYGKMFTAPPRLRDATRIYKTAGETNDLPKAQFGPYSWEKDPFLITGTPMQEYAVKMQQEQQPTMIADWNQTGESVVGTPEPTMAVESKKRRQFKTLGEMNVDAARSVNKLGYAADFLERFNQAKNEDKLRQKRGSTDLAFGVNPTMDRGDYLTTNVTQGPAFRPDQYTYAQKDINYYDRGPLQNIVKYGGILDQLEDGGVYDLSDDEIREILAAGGSIEYI